MNVFFQLINELILSQSDEIILQAFQTIQKLITYIFSIYEEDLYDVNLLQNLVYLATDFIKLASKLPHGVPRIMTPSRYIISNNGKELVDSTSSSLKYTLLEPYTHTFLEDLFKPQNNIVTESVIQKKIKITNNDYIIQQGLLFLEIALSINTYPPEIRKFLHDQMFTCFWPIFWYCHENYQNETQILGFHVLFMFFYSVFRQIQFSTRYLAQQIFISAQRSQFVSR